MSPTLCECHELKAQTDGKLNSIFLYERSGSSHLLPKRTALILPYTIYNKIQHIYSLIDFNPSPILARPRLGIHTTRARQDFKAPLWSPLHALGWLGERARKHCTRRPFLAQRRHAASSSSRRNKTTSCLIHQSFAVMFHKEVVLYS